jgi:hypothetical protein
MLYGRRSVAFRKSDSDAEARQQMRKQRMRRAIQLGDGDDILTHRGHVEHRIMQGGLSSADTERLKAPFERSDPPLQYGGCWITYPTVPVSVYLKVEQRSPMLGIVECIRNRLVDRDGYSLCCGISFVPGMECDRFIAEPPSRQPDLSHLQLLAKKVG